MTKQKRVFLDLETTGLNPKKHHIWQLAAIIEVNGEVVEELDLKVNPTDYMKFAPEAESGITSAEIEKFPLSSQIFTAFKEELSRRINPFDPSDKASLIGHNIHRFDEPFLREWWALNQDKYYGSWFYWPPIDTLLMASDRLESVRGELGKAELGNLAQFLGLKVEAQERHDALYDTRLMRQVFHELREYGD